MKTLWTKNSMINRALLCSAAMTFAWGCSIQGKLTDLSNQSLSDVPSSLSYSISTTYYKDDQVSVAPSSSSGLSQFSISPSLPPGLSINSNTGVISGSPQYPVVSQTYTITAKTSSGATLSTAATFAIGLNLVVNNNADTGDANVGDATCANATGQCTLRAALDEANSANWAAFSITITVPAMTITLGGTPLSVTNNVTIKGASAATTIVSGNNVSRVFNVTPADTQQITLDSITIQNGNSGAQPGGGLYYNTTTKSVLNLKNCIVTGSTSANSGGGLMLTGYTNIDNCTVTSNTTSGIAHYGAGIYYMDTTVGWAATDYVLNISNSTISSNSTLGGNSRGGGLLLMSGTAYITTTTFLNNVATLEGSGLHASFPGTFLMTNSLITGSSQAIVYFNSTGATAQFSNTTIYGLASALQTVIVHDPFSSGAITSFIDSTLVQTAAGLGVLRSSNSSVLKVKNTIISNSGGGANCVAPATISSLGYNVTSANDCGFAGTNDQNSKAHLAIFATGSLASNGGLTQTVALKSGGPAIDNGPATCSSTTDQRGTGYPRASGSACDTGAYEY